MLIYFKEVDLDEGFRVMAQPKGSRLVGGRSVSPPSGRALYEALRAADQPLRCWSCGRDATCFLVNKGSNDKIGPPVLDLYSSDGTDFVLMTRDHIIPKSYGGSNDVANLRVGCGPCNHGRGNSLDAEDIEFMKAHPELFVAGRSFILPDDVTSMDKVIGVSKKDLRLPQSPLTEEQKVARKERQKAKRKAAKARNAERKKAKKFPPLTTMLVLALA